jgi:hypothetical protein
MAITEPHDTGIGACPLVPDEEAYLAWSRAEAESERLIHAWFAVAGPEMGPAYRAYRLSLDREEAAALALRQTLRRDRRAS